MKIEKYVSRRTSLKLLGGAGAAVLVGWKSDWLARTSGLHVVRTAAAAGGTPDCVVRPALTEGPYFVDERLNRSDIRPDPSTGVVKQGLKLELTFNVRRMGDSDCSALPGAFVDVWHADAAGKYSDVAREGTSGQKFLRGYQVTDSTGVAKFTTVFPGWYRGRAVHIHFKIRTFSGDREAYEFTSQLFFDEATIADVMNESPYSQYGTPDTPNARDGIYNDGGEQLLLTASRDGNTLAATLDVALAGVPVVQTGTPVVTGARAKNRKLTVTGTDFAMDAAILVNGDELQTRNKSSNPNTALVAKSGAAAIPAGQTVTLRVRNPDGALSNEFSFTKPA